MISLIGKLAGQDFEEFDCSGKAVSCQQKETWTIKEMMERGRRYEKAEKKKEKRRIKGKQ